MKQKQRRKKRKKEIKTRNQKKAKNKDKKQERKKRRRERERERQRKRKRKWKGGRPRRNKGRHSKINKKCPFPGEKQVFLLKAKKGKINKTRNTPKNKDGYKEKKTRNSQKYLPKIAFQLSVKFFLFWWVSKFPFFDNLAKQARTRKTL